MEAKAPDFRKNTLSVTLMQTDLYWENVTANLSSLEEKIAALDKPSDVIVLPEMFNSGFTMNKELAEPMNFTTTKWMKQIASQTQALIIGSFAVRDRDRYFNRLCCVQPDGSVLMSDKRHLFSIGQEHMTYKPGKTRLTVNWKGWNICPLVCYDLRFPVWSRNCASDPYDLLVYVANWPSKRAHAWNTLLQARAIENQSYAIGVNRIGTDGNGLHYKGDSAAFDYLGEPVFKFADSEAAKTVLLSQEDLLHYRKSFPALADADTFVISAE
jgi:omega-amidase